MRELIVLQEDRETGAGLLAEAAGARGQKVITVEVARGDRIPRELSAEAGLLVTGARLGAPDLEHCPYFSRWMALIRQAAAACRPVLAVGTGAFVLAGALGGKVHPAREPEAGWGTVTLTAEGIADPIFSGLPVYLPVFHWRSETIEIPPGSVSLAGSPAAPDQAFRIGSTIYGLQYHLEATEAMIRSWPVLSEGAVPAAAGKAPYDDPFLDRRALERRADRLIQNFFELAS